MIDQAVLAAVTSVLKSKLKSNNAFGKKRGLPFPKQDAFVYDPSRFISALCTRRAGKSNGLARRFLNTMRKYPKCLCPYLALTRESAKNIMWEMLKEHVEEEKINASFTEHNLTMTLDNGSRLQLFGADMKNFISRLKGIKTPGVGVDEVQDYSNHISTLVDDVLSPAIIDYPDGWIALTGTPGPIPHGYFYEVTAEGKHGFSNHSWSIYDNPYIDNAKEFVDDLIQKKKWDQHNPTLLREWRGQWVLDLDSLVFKYDKVKNHYDHVDYSVDWEFVIGVDLGYDDADAIAVLGWNKYQKKAYLIEEQIDYGQTITELSVKIEALIKRFNPLRVVMDTGGLGKKIAEEIRKRHSLPIVAAEKTRKFEYIELLNDAMRMGNFFAKRDSIFAQDCARIKWETDLNHPEKLKISNNFHSDVCFEASTLIKTKKGFKRIDSINPGESVKTRYGYKKVLSSGITGISNTIELKFSNGSILRCTSNHPIFTKNRGFVRADALLYSDQVVINLEWQRKKLLHSMALAILGIQNRFDRILGIITQGIYLLGMEGAKKPLFIEPSGSSLMEKYQKVIKSTIKTETHLITSCVTSNVSASKSITKSTEMIKNVEEHQRKALSIWIKFETWQGLGMHLKKVICGINSTLKTGKKNLGLKLSPYVQFVTKSTKETQFHQVQSSTAPINVEPKQEDSLEKTMKEELVFYVKQILSLTGFLKSDFAASLVHRHTTTNYVPVYNLTVDEVPEYYANGVLVHNCDAALYSFREALHWLSEDKAVYPKVNTEEWYLAQAKEAEQMLLDKLQSEKNEEIWGDL